MQTHRMCATTRSASMNCRLSSGTSHAKARQYDGSVSMRSQASRRSSASWALVVMTSSRSVALSGLQAAGLYPTLAGATGGHGNVLRVGRGLGGRRGCDVVLLGSRASVSRRPCCRAGAAGLMSCPSLAEGHVDDSLLGCRCQEARVAHARRLQGRSCARLPVGRRGRGAFVRRRAVFQRLQRRWEGVRVDAS